MIGKFGVVALLLAATSAKDSSVRLCDKDKDLEVEFSQCDPLGQKRNGKYHSFISLCIMI